MLAPFSVCVVPLNFHEAVTRIIGWAREPDQGRYVCLANVHTLIETKRHRCVLRTLQRADLVLPDGMPLVWQMSGQKVRASRIAGMDLFPALCRAAEEAAVPVFFLGATDATWRAVRARLESRYPRIRIAGVKALPFRRLRLSERRDIVAQLRASGARLVFVALGCPKQELWMGRHRDALEAVLVGVGGAVEVFAGLRQRAPRAMRSSGLEWAFRLAQEPKRMWRRYLGTNTAYLAILLRHLVLGPGSRGKGARG